MIVQFFPRVAGVKVVTPWSNGNGRVDCVARLTRSLTSAEAERLEGMLGLRVQGNRLRYSCRPEELEQEEDRIGEALLRLRRPLSNGRERQRGRNTRSTQ